MMKIGGKILMVLAGSVATFLAGLFVGRCGRDRAESSITETKVITYRDTKEYALPTASSEKAIGSVRYALPAYCFRGGAGGEPRQQEERQQSEIEIDSICRYGGGAGGEPRCWEGDSLTVELPQVQRHYEDSTYEAWVSGPLDPRLDSLRVYIPTTILSSVEKKPPKRWHIGVSVGYGYGPGGFQPYAGVGVTYSIISF